MKAKLFSKIVKKIEARDPSVQSILMHKKLPKAKLLLLLEAIKNNQDVQTVSWATASSGKEENKIRKTIEAILLLHRIANKDPTLTHLDLSKVATDKEFCQQLLQCINANEIIEQVTWNETLNKGSMQELKDQIEDKVFTNILHKIAVNDKAYDRVPFQWLNITADRLRAIWKALQSNDFISSVYLQPKITKEPLYSNIQKKLVMNSLKNNAFAYTHLDLKTIPVDINQLKTIWEALQTNSVVGNVTWGETPATVEAGAIIKKIEKKIIHNNSVYEYHPRDFIHGLLSEHVYSYDVALDHEGIDVKFGSDFATWNRYLKGWKVAKVFEDPASGLRCIFYTKDHYLVVSFRGTTIAVKDMVTKDSSLQTDIHGIIKGYTTIQHILCHKMAECANDFARDRYHISSTGHSLGGWLSQLFGYYCTVELGQKVKVVAFDSPGVSEIIKKGASNIVSSATKNIGEYLVDFTVYVGAPNLVNCCNSPIGRVVRVFPKVKENTKSGKFFRKVIDLLKEVDITYKVHGLTTIVKTFNPDTGLPKKQAIMDDWPSIRYKSSKQSGATSIMKYFATSVLFATPVSRIPMGPFLIPRIIDKLIPDIGLVSLINVFIGYVSGKFDKKQFAKAIHRLKGENCTVDEEISHKDAFLLHYEDHYAESKLNRHFDVLNLEHKGGVDWYLKRLENLALDNSLLGVQLKAIQSAFKIKIEAGKRHICTVTIPVATLRQRMQRLLDIYPDLLSLMTKGSAPKRKVILSILPEINAKHIVQRPQITEKITNILKKDQIVVLSAVSGLGKKTCAYEYAKSQSAMVTRSFNCAEVDLFEEEVMVLANVAFGIKKTDSRKVFLEKFYTAIRSYGQDFLFIFDNVKDYAQIGHYIVALPSCVKVILLTETSFLPGYNGKYVFIPYLSKKEVEEYIRENLKQFLEDDEIEESIDATLKHPNLSPRILHMATSYISKSLDSSVDGFIRIIRSSRKTLFDSIDKQSLSWIIAQAFVVFDLDSLSFRLLKMVVAAFYKEVTFEVLMEDLASNLLSLAIADLERTQEKIVGISIPSAVKDELKQYMDDAGITDAQKNSLRLNITQTIEKILPTPSNRWKKGFTARKMQRNTSIVSKILHVNMHYFQDKTAEKDSMLAALFLIRKKLARFYALLEKHEQSLNHLFCALEVAKSIYKEDDEKRINLLEEIAQAYINVGDIDMGFKMQSSALKKWADLQGKDSRPYAEALSKMGDIYIAKKDFNSALEVKTKYLSMMKLLYNENSLQVAYALVDIAKIYIRSQNPKKALQSIGNISRICDSIYNDKVSVEKADLYSSIATTYGEMDLFDSAIKCRRIALAIYKEKYGSHSDTIDTLHKLGKVLYKKGCIDEAFRSFVEAKDMCYAVYKGHEHKVFCNILIDLAQVECKLQQTSSAKRHISMAYFMSVRLGDQKLKDATRSLLKEVKNIALPQKTRFISFIQNGS